MPAGQPAGIQHADAAHFGGNGPVDRSQEGTVRRPVVFALVLFVVISLSMAVPALATPPSGDIAASQSFTSTLEAADSGTYHISLMGGLDFATCDVGQTISSQNSPYVSNDGTKAFDVYISANTAPSALSQYHLAFSDSPGQDEVRWTLSTTADMGVGKSVDESRAVSFGTLEPGDGMTLYSSVEMGTALTHPGRYTWSATVYAVPAS